MIHASRPQWNGVWSDKGPPMEQGSTYKANARTPRDQSAHSRTVLVRHVGPAHCLAAHAPARGIEFVTLANATRSPGSRCRRARCSNRNTARCRPSSVARGIYRASEAGSPINADLYPGCRCRLTTHNASPNTSPTPRADRCSRTDSSVLTSEIESPSFYD